MVVWLYPYLPLTRRVSVGSWTLIPVGDLQDADAVNADAAEQARGIHALYRLSGDRRGFGAFVRGVQPVGEELDSTGLGLLRLAVVPAMLDRNPSRADPGDEPDNAAHAMCTSENALLFGHGVDPDGYTAFSYGTMVQMFVGGARAARVVNVKPSRIGSLRELFEIYARCARDQRPMYGGGMAELGVGRGQIQLLAACSTPMRPTTWRQAPTTKRTLRTTCRPAR